jgi:hypothetical protein
MMGRLAIDTASETYQTCVRNVLDIADRNAEFMALPDADKVEVAHTAIQLMYITRVDPRDWHGLGAMGVLELATSLKTRGLT